MNNDLTLDLALRAIVREAVREEVRAVLAEQDARNVRPLGAEGQGYLSIARAAAFADVAPGTLRRWIRSGRLPVRRAGRVYRVGRADLEDFLAREGQSAAVAGKARAILGRAA